MSKAVERHTGVVARVTPSGLGIVKDDATGDSYYFTFDKIPGYRGEPAKEAGIKVGSEASFTTDVGSAAVTSITIDKTVSVEPRPTVKVKPEPMAR